jgi:hypothetical protein
MIPGRVNLVDSRKDCDQNDKIAPLSWYRLNPMNLLSKDGLIFDGVQVFKRRLVGQSQEFPKDAFWPDRYFMTRPLLQPSAVRHGTVAI